MKRSADTKPKNKTYVTCTLDERRVKGIILAKDDAELVVGLPTGYEMVMHRRPKGKFYRHTVGTLEFVSDGWPVA